MNIMDCVEIIKKLLDERGWSQYRLAKEADLSQSTISSIMLRGSTPTVKTIEHCCRAFDITIAEFFSMK